MVAIDLHTHSRFFHGFQSRPTWYDGLGFRALVATARSRNLDAIAVTNHDYFSDFDVRTGDLTVVPGIEISTTSGHLLVVGEDPPSVTKPSRMSPAKALALARERNCAAIMAHPFRNSRLKETDLQFDAVEVNGKRSRSPSNIEDLAAEHDLPLVGGSDAHYPLEVGRTYTEVAVESVTPGRVVEAIWDGRTDYRTVDRFYDRSIRRTYRVIHRLKGHIEAASDRVDGNSDENTAL